MSAAFALQPSGPPAPCGYPKCTLDAWHPGDHLLAAKPNRALEFPGPRYGVCVVCRAKFVEYGDHAYPASRICDSQECLIELCHREAVPFPILCPCGQRPYPHELSVHKLLRRESYNPNLNFKYPWSLCLSERREMSAEHDMMGLYNFQLRFVQKILSGEKTHTIRAMRANPDKPGNTLHLYTGLRHKGARLLMRVPCVKVEEIAINSRSGDPAHCRLEINGQFLDRSEKEVLARRDGFKDFAEMLRFWDGRLPFCGHIIHWKYPQRRKAA